ncbi:MAG: DUF1549 and DUF1553 domain-containing protein [Planctomycetota bacterium]
MTRPRVLALWGVFVCLPLASASRAQADAPAAAPQPRAAQESGEMAQRREHWAWQPLAAVEPPAAGHPVDAFVADALRARGLEAAPAAAPHTQLRRLWFDLVGLPPSPAAVERFLADPSESAWLREVDALLASPHFGERWGRHWLDLMRYCETLGHEFDYELPNAWRYRDYVIRALNADVPYDQFVREHIAGDLMDPPRRDAEGRNESVQATASWWFPEQTHSPVDAMQHQADRIDNQIDVFGKAFLGMTIACARCHDHKFDAIPTRDYYSLFGYVQSSRYVQAPIQPVAPNAAPYRRALALQRDLAAAWRAGPAEAAAPAAAPDASPGRGFALRPEDVRIADADEAERGWYLTGDAFGDAPWAEPFCPDPTAEKPRLVSLPGRFWVSAAAGPRREGTLATRSFPLEHRYVHVRTAGDHSRLKLIVDGLHVVRDPIYGSLHRNIDRPDAHWVTFDIEMWRGRTAFLQAIDQREPDLGDPRHNRGRYPDKTWIAVQVVCTSPHRQPPTTADGPAVLELDRARSTPQLDAALTAFAAAADALPVSPTVPAMADGSGIDSYVYLRGSHKNPGQAAPRAFLSAVAAKAAPAAQSSSGRLQLADAVLSPGDPLPARVLVNRVWHHLFGRGIVKSVDNFGALGDAPTHPALLDWLARDFRDHDWSLKHVVRRVVTSDAYRRTSGVQAASQPSDPTNALVHRQNVRPLEAEIVRDALLSISGSLDPQLYGRSIEQPREAITDARGKPGHHDPLDGKGRRSVYLAVRRNFMNEMMLAFDQPTPFATVGRRNTSNVPAQALALANAPLVHELCRRFADRVLAHSDDPTERLQWAYKLAFGRLPRAAELARLLPFVEAPGDEREVWFDALHALINTTEFRFRR